MIYSFKDKKPVISENCFVAENATVVGDVIVGKGSSIWFGAVLRGDEENITIGEGSNVQDNAVLHCDGENPLTIGNYVTIGHGALVHGATVGDSVLVGMGAIVMSGAVIGENSVIGAGAVVTGNMVIPEGSVVVGVPAKVVKNTAEHNNTVNMLNASAYIYLSEIYSGQG